MAEPMLRAEGLSLKAGGATDLASISFSVERGRLAAVVGPDDWDKDGLVALLQGTRVPTHGTLRLAGRPITQRQPAERVRAGLAWTTRPPLTLASDTLVEAIVVAMSAPSQPSPLDFFRRQPSQPSAAAAVEVLQFVGLGSRSGASPSVLDGVDRARLEIARTLVTRPRLVVVDRLTSLVPRPARRAFTTLLRHLADSDVTVLWVEDDAALALETADQVIGLHHGRTLGPITVGKAADTSQIEAAFLGQRS